MGLMPAFYTTTNTKKRKQKFKSAEQKRKHEKLAQDWENLKRKYDVKSTKRSDEFQTLTSKPFVPPRGHSVHHPSLNSNAAGGTIPIDGKKVYTGTKMIGIGTLHKSNAVPVFSDDDAKEIARMRRG